MCLLFLSLLLLPALKAKIATIPMHVVFTSLSQLHWSCHIWGNHIYVGDLLWDFPLWAGPRLAFLSSIIHAVIETGFPGAMDWMFVFPENSFVKT